MESGVTRALDAWWAARERPCVPNPTQALFLQACLWPVTTRAAAYAAWVAAVGDPLRALAQPTSADRYLMPLLYRALTAVELEPAGEVMSVLRASTAHEQLRWEAVGAAAGEVIGLLAEARIEVAVVGGAALAFGRYADPVLRHCHNVDLLVSEPLFDRACVSLAAFECRRGADGLLVEHPSGTPIALRSRPFRAPRTGREVRVESLCETVTIAGRCARMLEPADQFVQVCTNAAAVIDPGLRWLVDAAVLAQADLDWERVLADTRLVEGGVAVTRTLAYLTTILAFEAPAASSRALAALARTERRRATLVGALRRTRRGVNRVLAHGRA